MKTSAKNNTVIAKGSATFGSKPCGNLHEATSDLRQGDCFVDNHDISNLTLKAPRNDSPRFFSRLLLIGLMTLLLTPLSFAQDFDANRMNRDIKIMESILGEMFKTQVISDEGIAQVRGNATVFWGNSSSSNVKGTYIPGYGIIFMIPSSVGRSYVVASRNSNAKVVFQYSSDSDESDRSIDKESITNRIGEFLQDYASTIGQLKPDESILVIYGSGSSSGNRISVYNIRGNLTDDDQPEPIPVISVSAKKSDLDAFRSGRLSSDAFQNRISVSESEDKQRLDLKVLGNIFSTALGEGDGNQFHLINNNSLSYLYLDNFGALYSLNLHRGHGFGSISASVRSASVRLFEAEVNERDEDNADNARVILEEKEEELAQTLKEEYDTLVAKTKEFIIDYGRTLSSLKDDQYLMVSLNISDSSDFIPERLDFQVQKTVFNQLDRGQISREQALNAVTITEY